MNLDVDDVLGWSVVGAIVAAFAALVVWGVVALVKTTATSGAIDFCVVEYRAPLYAVWTHRPWRSDGTLAVVPSLDEAVKAAEAAHCPLSKP